LKLYHELLGRNPGKVDSYIATLHRETERLSQIIEGLLALSRLDQDSITLKLQEVDLNDLVQTYVRDRPLLAESRGLTLTLNPQPDLPPLQLDANLLGQTLSIMLTNALNYTPRGGKVAVSTLTREADGILWVGFSVQDSGPGIPPEEQARLYDRFFRGSAGREANTPGTGLGLAIARAIVERHHGRIEVHSEGIPGLGTTFIVLLPVVGSVAGAPS
jgi:signal transduction histidine kinase